ncbi:glycoside hydrolase superfamily [Powellomyces hirtus]|nr:glycoside hydrolase superfamily [Powellomyces hirtus]
MTSADTAVFRNPASNKCIAIDGFSREDGAAASIMDCDSNKANQLIHWPNPAGDISFVHSNKCLDLDVHTRKVQQWTCSGTNNQKWDIKPWKSNDQNGSGGAKPFFGLAYSDVHSVAQAQTELTFLSKYTHAIRTYDAQASAFALEAIHNANLPMKVLVNMWSHADDGHIQNQQNLIVQLAKKYPNLIYGVSVGNEPSLPATAVPYWKVMQLIQSTRSRLANEANWRGTVSVIDIVNGWLNFNGDYSQSTPTELLKNVDQVYVDAYPIYAGFNAANGDALNYIKTVVEKQFGSQCNGGTCMNGKPRLVITETGHPTAGSCGSCGNSKSGLNEMNTFMSQITCYTASAGIDLFYFQAFDKPAGQAPADNIESHFGVFTRDGLRWKTGVNDLSLSQPKSCMR